MTAYQDEQPIGQLGRQRGGYCYLRLDAQTVQQFPRQRHTRLICRLEGQIEFRCGLNHLGDGHFFIILSARHLASLGKAPGDRIRFVLTADPDPLGVEMPEVLEALLSQDEALQAAFGQLSLGKQRNVIHQLIRIRNPDLQIARAGELIRAAGQPRRRS
ncbi:MAG: YdeI/OmpD-associated family protein [Bacteroidia bacterium]|nr:YdeI/OmpD-associated family protein [Bacteroidia bacterium]